MVTGGWLRRKGLALSPQWLWTVWVCVCFVESWLQVLGAVGRSWVGWPFYGQLLPALQFMLSIGLAALPLATVLAGWWRGWLPLTVASLALGNWMLPVAFGAPIWFDIEMFPQLLALSSLTLAGGLILLAFSFNAMGRLELPRERRFRLASGMGLVVVIGLFAAAPSVSLHERAELRLVRSCTGSGPEDRACSPHDWSRGSSHQEPLQCPYVMFHLKQTCQVVLITCHPEMIRLADRPEIHVVIDRSRSLFYTSSFGLEEIEGVDIDSSRWAVTLEFDAAKCTQDVVGVDHGLKNISWFSIGTQHSGHGSVYTGTLPPSTGFGAAP